MQHQTDDFNEDWEKALYRICYIRPRLKPRVTDISKFFNFIKDKYTEGDDEDLGTTIQEVLSKTSVTSVSATDQAQNIVLPEREKGSYKRRVLNDLDTYLLDLKVTHNCCEKSVQTNKYIHDKMLEKFKDITPYYTGSMTFQFNKRKFMKISAKYENENSFLVKAQILKHYKHDYMIPALDGFEIKMGRKFSKGKMSTAHNAEFYELRILDESVYKKNENLFWKCIEEAYDMMRNNNDKILKIDYRKGNLSSAIKNIENNQLEVEEFCEKVLNPDYRYDLK